MLKTALLLLAGLIGQVDRTVDRSSTSVIMHVFIGDSSVTTGAGLTGLTNASSGLVISAIHPGDASATVYSVASSNVETISTLGTYAAPTSGKVRFKELDSTNMPGVYELHLANGLFSVSSDTTLRLTLKGATNMRVTNYVFQIGSPANMVRINGDATSGNNATLALKQLHIVNTAGDALYAESQLSGYSGIYAKGSGGGDGLRGQGGNGTPGTPATSGQGIQGIGGSSYNGGGTPTDGFEWGAPGIRAVGGAGGGPGMTMAGTLGHPGNWITQFGDGTRNAPPLLIGEADNAGLLQGALIGLHANSSTTRFVAFKGGDNPYPFDASDTGGIADWFTPGLKVHSITGVLSSPFKITDSGNNFVTLGDLAGVFADDTLNGIQFICSNYQNAIVTDYEGATGKATIRCTQSNGNWLSNPGVGTDTIQFGNFPMELTSTTASSVLSTSIETGITSGAGLVNDSGTQLTSINLKQAIALIMSATSGKLTGSGTTTITIYPAGKPGSSPRITATVGGGNRTAINAKVPD